MKTMMMPTPSTRKSNSDRTSIAKAAEGGKAEVDLAGLALQKAASGDIAEFERVAAGAWTPAHQRHTTGRSAGRIQGFFGPH